MGEKNHRTFVAIFPPPAVAEMLASIQAKLRSPQHRVRWEKKEKLHITLEFLGNKSQAWIDELACELRKALLVNPFSLFLTRCGVFPQDRNPKVIWIGPERDIHHNEINAAAAAIRTITGALGHRHDDTPFAPHVTIGRMKGKVSPGLIQNVETLTFHPVEFTCTEVRLIKSERDSAGSQYTTLYTFPLK